MKWSGTHQQSPLSSQLPIQPTWEGSWHTRFVGIIHAHDPTQCSDGCNRASQQEKPLRWCEMPILLRTEHAQNVIVFVNRFAKVAPLLLVPPIAIRVSKLSWLSRRVDITAILDMDRQLGVVNRWPTAALTISGSSISGSPV